MKLKKQPALTCLIEAIGARVRPMAVFKVTFMKALDLLNWAMRVV
jgi:hypothetical protein